MPIPKPVLAMKKMLLDELDDKSAEYPALRKEVEKGFKKRMNDYREKRWTACRRAFDNKHKKEAEEWIYNDKKKLFEEHRVSNWVNFGVVLDAF